MFKATFSGLAGHFTPLLTNPHRIDLRVAGPFAFLKGILVLYDSNCYEHLCARFCVDMFLAHSGDYPGAQLLGHLVRSCLAL